MEVEALLDPADLRRWAPYGAKGAVCVVFDVFRATSVIVAALAAGASEVWPADDIPEALALEARIPSAVLGGERHSRRIGPELTGGRGFDLGNSPREYTPDVVRGRPVILTTTNGTRSLRACRPAAALLAASFSNLRATARWLRAYPAPRIALVAAGTGDTASLEDILAVGALVERLGVSAAAGTATDGAETARLAWLGAGGVGAAAASRNARRLSSIPELAADVTVCLTLDSVDSVALAGADGALRRITP